MLFFIHIIIVAGFTLLALRFGKEALITIICLYCILANLFVTKQISLFGMSVVSTDVFMVGSILGLNMLQEFFGKEIVKKTILLNFFVMVLYLALSQIHLWYTPNIFDTTHDHFFALLTPMPRIIIASVLVYLLVQIIDAYLYGILKVATAGRWLMARNILSLSISQLIDTVLFSFAALYGTVHSVFDIIIVSYSLKVLVIMCSSPCISLAKKFITSK